MTSQTQSFPSQRGAASFRRAAIIVLAVWVAFLLLLALNLWLVSRGFGRLYEADFIQNGWLGGYLVAHGQDPYNATAWQAAKETFLPRPELFPRFLYPIWVAALCGILGLLPPLTALAAWTSVNILLLYASLRLCFTIANRRVRWLESGTLLVLALLFLPVLHGLLEGQYTILVLFLLLATVALMQRGSSYLNGIPLAVALLKPQSSALLVVALLWWAASHRRWRDLAGFGAVSAVLWLGPLALYPNWPSEWAEAARWQGVYLVKITPSVWGLAYQVAPGIAFPVALVASGLVLWVTASWWVRRAPQAAPSEVAPLSAVNLLVSFYGLPYEQVSLLFPFWTCWLGARALTWRLGLVAWIGLLPLCLAALLALNPPWNLVFAIVQPISIIAIYATLLNSQGKTG